VDYARQAARQFHVTYRVWQLDAGRISLVATLPKPCISPLEV
jgi:hypothetical protein